MDPFEEFEFKPLTNGLGFHKKSISDRSAELFEEEIKGKLPESAPRAATLGAAEASTPVKSRSYEEILASLGASKPLELTETLPRASDVKPISALEMEIPPPVGIPGHEPRAPQRPQPSIEKPSFFNPTLGDKVIEETGVRRGAADSPTSHLVPVPISFQAAILDFVVVIAIALMFLISLLMVTKVDLMAVALNAQLDWTTQLSLGILFIAVMQMYVVVARSFFGRTLGEWTFDCQMGKDDEHSSGVYPLKVAWRSIVVTLTGVIVLPLLSWVFNRDLASKLTSLQLYRQR